MEPAPRPRIVLASGSPRRRELLDQLGLRFEVRPADIDESVLDGEEPRTYVARLSREKAAAVDAGAGVLVIAADTTVDVDGTILGKPADDAEARAMLMAMSGRRHHVHTGLTVRIDDRSATSVTTTAVDVVAIDDALASWYVATREPFDKAGGYAIQGAGGVLVAAVEGSVSNVIGLPLATLSALARELGVRLP
ncbi:MAG: septum formation protein Maf [Acidimicrobiales bacterium]|nr:septum formation protein Maf [Acidimicrobiales bacterium]MCB9392419.1 septum formation protein Maf [Acidimicrobiaceae bacterium]